MGTAPSAEIVRDAPFRSPQGGVRQVALIPLVEQYFPTPDCPLFKQLYDAYTDPSVRYYMRFNFKGAGGDFSRIPPIAQTREEMHTVLMRHTAQGMFPTNAAVREVYEIGDFYRIRPVLCAVVFLYEGANYVPEGSVQLPPSPRGGPPAFVKVIGIIGDTNNLVQHVSDPFIPYSRDDRLNVRALIMKSAGDHNMSRVVLLAAYIYYHQCCSIIGLPNVPTLPARFTCFKTNIPFLCFLREMRDRTSSVLAPPKDSKFYIDEHCLHGAVDREYVAKMMPAFACYYISFLNAKSEQRALKQRSHHQHGPTSVSATTAAGRKEQLSPAGSGTLANRVDSHVASVYGEASIQQAVQALKEAAAESATAENGGSTPKITYIVKGYVTRAKTTLSGWTHAANEVYVVCQDSVITVVKRASVDGVNGPTYTPTPCEVEEVAEEAASAEEMAVVETLRVQRGDILSFYVPAGMEAVEAASAGAVVHEEDEDDLSHPNYLEVLKLNASESSTSSVAATKTEAAADSPAAAAAAASSSSSSSASSSSLSHHRGSSNSSGESRRAGTGADVCNEAAGAAAGAAGAADAAAEDPTFTPQLGSWRIDESIFIENVLLSLVRDECKLAREATEQDPGWAYDEEKKCLVHDGSFYVWHFRRGCEDFYYGTVPKFANPNRQLVRGGATGNSTNNNSTSTPSTVAHVGGTGTQEHSKSSRRSGSGGTQAKEAGPAATGSSGSRGGPGRGKKEGNTPSNAKAHAPLAATKPFDPAQLANFAPALSQQSLQLSNVPLLPSGLAAASPDVQRAFLASMAAGQQPQLMAPPPPAYSAADGGSQIGALKQGPYAAYPTTAVTAADAAPLLYAYLPPSVAAGQGRVSPPQQPQMQAYAMPGIYGAAMQPPQPQQQQPQVMPLSPPQTQQQPQQAVWGTIPSAAHHLHAAAMPTSPVVPCFVNAQGQLVPIANAGPAVQQQPLPQPAPQFSYAPPMAAAPPPGVNYVMVNGQLCILHTSPPSTSGAAPAPPAPMQAYAPYPAMMAYHQQ